MIAGTAPATRYGQRLIAWIVDHRVHITTVVFLALISEDVFTGVKPHDLTNWHDSKSMIGLALVLAGLALRSWAAGVLHKSTQLTTHGPYALVRNPLYVGSFLMMVGFCIVIDDAENIWFVLGPFLAMFVFKVRTEERGLAERFGEAWRHYAQTTPRFIPSLPSRVTSVAGGWNLRQWINNREYQAMGAVMLGLVALKAWHTV